MKVTPTSTAPSGPESGVPGTAVVGQMVHGHEPDVAMDIVNVAVADWAGLPESTTFTVKVNVPATVGVPESVPVELPRVIPVGSVPLEIDEV